MVDDNAANAAVEMLTRFQAGDETVVTELMHLYRARLLGFVRSYISDHLKARTESGALADTAFREFLNQAKSKPDAPKNEEQLWAWLSAIAWRKTLNHVQKEHRQKRDPRKEVRLDDRLSDNQETIADTISDTSMDPQLRIELSEELRRFLDELPERHRAILLQYLAGKSISELADIFDRAESTIQDVIARARRRLSQRLSEELGLSDGGADTFT